MGVPVFYQGSKYYPGIPPSKQYPAFSAAEVGTVNASTVAVTFSIDVSASDYAAGVTIKVNGSGATISSATRQANHAVVYYVISAAVANGDAVTWEYAGGSIVNEATGAALQTTNAQSVTNNVAQDIGDTLRAACKAYWKMDETSGTRADSTGRGNDLTVYDAPTAISGKVDGAVTLGKEVASADRLYHAYSADLSYYQKDFYAAGWIRINTAALQPALVSIWDIVDGEEWSIDYNLDGTLDVSAGNNAYATVAASVGDWHFVEVYLRYGADDYGIAVDNGIFVTGSAIGEYQVSTAKFCIGYLTDNSLPDPFVPSPNNFSIDEFGIWHRLLTQDERDYLYNSGAGRALFPAP